MERLGSRPLPELLRVLARAGVSLVQLRAKALGDAQLLEQARAAVVAAREAGLLLIVNDRPDVARLAGADGVHLGQDDLPAAAARELLPEALIGVSTHDPGQLRRALAAPVDYLAVGPVYPTRSKPDPDPVVGLALVREAARTAGTLPVVAIGGITRARAAAVLDAGARGLAVIGDLLDAADPGAVAGEFAALLGAAPGYDPRP